MPLISSLSSLLSRASRALGLETIDTFPPGHQHARTRWDRAYFDIASNMKPAAIEYAMCEAIANTPTVFGHIVHPTPRMQRALLAVIENRLRRSCTSPADLVRLLVDAYDSPDTQEALPGLRRAIERSAHAEMPDRVRELLGYLQGAPGAFGVVDAGGGTVLPPGAFPR
jgi:hypothetical protein